MLGLLVYQKTANKEAKMATRKKKSDNTETRVVKGSHLTITYDANDYPIKLEWDDEALLSDVRNAILKAESTIPVTEEMKPAVKAKAVTRKKKEATKASKK
jgi:hypothetical protein